MILSEKINKILPYFKGIEVIDGQLIVKLHLEKGWFCYEKPDVFSVMKINDENNSWAVMCNANSKKSDEIFDFIDEIIETNKSVKLKMDLLKIKINELKELFAVTPLDELLKLKFIIEKDNNIKKKRTYKKREKKIQENIIENDEKSDNNVKDNIVNDGMA